VPRVLAADLVSFVLGAYASPTAAASVVSSAGGGAAAAALPPAGRAALRAMLLRATRSLLVPLLLRQLPGQASFPLLLRCFRMARDACVQLALSVVTPPPPDVNGARNLSGSSSGSSSLVAGLRALVSLLVSEGVSE
jgi:hypothetical protein